MESLSNYSLKRRRPYCFFQLTLGISTVYHAQGYRTGRITKRSLESRD